GKGELKIRLKDESVLGMLYRTRESYFQSEAQTDPYLSMPHPHEGYVKGQSTFTRRQKVMSFAGVPMIGQDGSVLGFLCVNYRTRTEFPDEHRNIIELFAQQAALVVEEVRT